LFLFNFSGVYLPGPGTELTLSANLFPNDFPGLSTILEGISYEGPGTLAALLLIYDG